MATATSHGSRTRKLAFAAPANRLSTLPEGEPKFTLGWGAIHWAESILIQPNGPRAGMPFRFTRDQMRFLLWWYAMDRSGMWLYNHGVRRLAKGSGKSPFAAVESLIELCGPVRLDRKDSRLPGGCVGKAVAMPLVQIVATAESQTANTMRMVRAFAPRGSAVVEECGLDVGKTIYYKVPDGKLETTTSSVTASEGGETSLVVADETEHWRPSNGGPELFATHGDNLAKSGSRMIETSNAWIPGVGSVAEASWDAWVAQEEGRLQGKQRILYDARVAPPDTDLADRASLTAALEWVYGDCDWRRDKRGRLDVSAIVERIWSPMSKPSESRRKYLNQPTVHEESWTDPLLLALIAQPRKVSEKEEVVLFFDGSKSRDATAFVACCVDDGHVFVPLVPACAAAGLELGETIWEPDPNDDEDVVPVAEVDLAATQIFERYNVVAFFGDVREWESFVKIDWPARFAEQMEKANVKKGRAQLVASSAVKDHQVIAWDMRGHELEFTRAAELTDAEITAAGFTYDGSSALTRHISNMRRRPNRWGVSVGKASPASPLKIDAGVCMIGARHVRRLLLALPVTKKKSGAVW